jgi:hypothetical protein
MIKTIHLLRHWSIIALDIIILFIIASGPLKAFSQDELPPLSGLKGLGLDKINIGGNESQKKTKKALANPMITNALIKVSWKQLEPRQGKYDWSMIEKKLSFLPSGKKATIAVLAGADAPLWIYDEPKKVPFVTRDNSYGGISYRMPVMTHANYLTKWTKFIHAFGEKYNSDSRLTVVGMTGIGSDTAEYGLLRLERKEMKQLMEEGMDACAILSANEMIFSAFRDAFPSKFLSLTIGRNPFKFFWKKADPSDQSCLSSIKSTETWGWGNELTKATQQQAYHLVGKNRFVLKNAGLTGEMTANPEKAAILSGMTEFSQIGGHTAWQMGGSVTDDPAHRMGAGTSSENLQNAFTLGLQSNPLYIEIYREDLLASDEDIQNILKSAYLQLIKD